MPPAAACEVEYWLQLASGVLAGVAALIWFFASRVEAPAELTRQHVRDVQGDIIPILDRLLGAVARQSRLNATAALFAALAALCQFVHAFMPSCWSGMPWVAPN
jgi:hypothetical protein